MGSSLESRLTGSGVCLKLGYFRILWTRSTARNIQHVLSSCRMGHLLLFHQLPRVYKSFRLLCSRLLLLFYFSHSLAFSLSNTDHCLNWRQYCFKLAYLSANFLIMFFSTELLSRRDSGYGLLWYDSENLIWFIPAHGQTYRTSKARCYTGFQVLC